LDNSAAQGQASAFYSAPSRGGHPPQQHQPLRPPQQESTCPPAAPPPLAQPPTMAVKTMVKGKRKARTTAPVAPTTTTGAATPRRGPPTIPGPTLSRCGQGCALLSSWHIHRSTPCLLHRRTTVPSVALPSHPYRRLNRTNSRSRPLPGRPGRGAWDQQSLANSFSTMALTPPTVID
jgi:hypothetical protein